MKTETNVPVKVSIVQNPESGMYIGTVDDIDGIVLQGKTPEEIIEKVPRAVHSMLIAIHKKEIEQREQERYIESNEELSKGCFVVALMVVLFWGLIAALMHLIPTL